MHASDQGADAPIAVLARTLHSSATQFENKLAAAGRLVELLLPQHGANESNLPALVQAHYLRSLLDWALGAVTKVPAAAQAAAKAEVAPAPRQHPDLWRLLVTLLNSDAVAASYVLPASLLPAATEVLHAIRSDVALDASVAKQLLRPAAALLHALGHKFAGSFKPGLEPVASAAEAVLLGATHAAGNQGWATAVEATAALLLACTQQPNQRKVWDAVVPRLVTPLLGAAFGWADADAADGSSRAVESCRRVLAAVLFNQAHVAALAEACAPAAADEAGDAADGGRKPYAWQLLKLLAGSVASLGSAQDCADDAVSNSLPWLVEQNCFALAEHRRAAEVAAAITRRAGQQWDPPAGGDGASGGGVSRSADFHFYSAVMQPLLDRLAGAEEPAIVEQPLRAAARLTATLQAQRIYRPTEDPGGAHRGRLAEVAAATVAAAAGAPGAGVVGAALQVLQAILAVEHRVVQEHLPALWPLVWAGGASEGAAGAAVGVACALVGAYAELRQLDVLLSSIVHAVRAGHASAAADVLCCGEFVAALQGAVRQLPSGQVAGVVRLVASWAPTLAEGLSNNVGGAAALVIADLGGACLDSLRVDIVTAPAAANAAAALIERSLAAPLLQLLGRGDSASLAAALRLYRSALRLHAYCCALHPQVAPLPGQSVRPGGGAAGYFAAAFDHHGAPELVALVTASMDASGSSPALKYAALAAAAQRLGTLHLRRAYRAHRCGDEEELGEGDQAEVLVGAEGEQAEEAELQALAALLARAAGGGSSGSRFVALATQTAQGLASAAAALAAAHLEQVQGWAPEAELAALTRAVLAGACGSQPELLELERLRKALPSVACDQLHSLLINLPSSTTAAAKKRGKGGNAAAGAGAAIAQLLEQLKRAGKGKALKPAAWTADLHAGCAAVTAAAQAGAAASALPITKSKKRKATAAPTVDASAAHGICALLRTLSALELSSLEAEGVAALLAAGTAASLAVLHAALTAASDAVAAFRAAAAGMAVVARAVLNSGAGISSKHAALLLRQDIPAFAAAVSLGSGALMAMSASSAASVSMESIQSDCRRALVAFANAALRQSPGSGGDGEAELQAAVARAAGVDGSGGSWVDVAVLEAILAAASAAADANTSGPAAARDTIAILCGGGAADQEASPISLQLLNALIEQAEATVPAIGAFETPASWEAQCALGAIAASRAHLLSLRCAGGPAGDNPQQPTRVVAAMPADVAAVAEILTIQGATLAAPVVVQLVAYLEAACRLVHHTKPPASAAHYSSLLALLLHLLRTLPPAPAELDAVRRTLPFTALFPAAGGSLVRAALLRALRALVEGSSNQQLSHALRLAECSLLGPPAGDAGSYALPLAELALMALEGAAGGGAARTLGQHADRLCAALTASLMHSACPLGEGALTASGPNTFAALLEAAMQASPASEAPLPAPPAQRPAWATAVIEAEGPDARSAAACTALRALESMAARPRQFAVAPRQLCHMVQCIQALWAGNTPSGWARLPRSPALFCASCHLLTALLRHHEREAGRCLPLLAEASRALLIQLAAWEAAAGGAGADSRASARVHCAELLANVYLEISGLRGAASYCPHLLADYLVLAEAPPTPKSRAMLAQLSNGGADDAGAPPRGALSSSSMSPAAAAALRHGAFALYGACGATELQYLYSALGGGGGGGGAWRAALAELKADHDEGFKYTGKV